jgi:hypothetical protein
VQLRWYRPTREEIRGEAASRAGASLDAGASIEPRRGFGRPMEQGQRDLLFRVGIPIPEPGVGVRDFAVHLLKIAAEVEHALMVQYLYAAVSLNPAEDTSPENYPVKLMRIAIQEMGHLATVQNLLLLTGGPQAVHLQRDSLRTSSGLDPIPFVLEPVSLPALAKFVAAEMPSHIPAVRLQQVAELLKIAKTSSGVEPHRVGAIYTMLRLLYLPQAEAEAWLNLSVAAGLPADFHLADSDLTGAADMEALEARIDEWDANLPDFILDTPRTCANAAETIALVAEQGEGWSESQDSHFAEFLEFVDAFESGALNPLLRPIAQSPTLTEGLGGEQGVVITDPYTMAWGEVFSLQYTLLVLSIQHSLVTRRASDGSPGLREGLADLALRGMRRIIQPVSSILTTLPLHSGDPQAAGPPYDLDPIHLAPGDDGQLRGRHRTCLDRLAVLYTQIETSPEFATHTGHDIAIANLRSFDKRRGALLFPIPPT